MNDLEIFSAAIELQSPEERARYLAQACGDNRELRRRIDELLGSHAQVGSFMDAAVPAAAQQMTLDDPITERPGTVIGPYKLLEQIGEGGFGVVFMAEQHRPVRRKVALKVVKPGMDTRQVVARFEAERQALALMDHPSIAQVFDGGETDSGRPYFVMELVRGIPVTDFCDQNHLPIRERLELFVSVCQAVQHAHLKGIIHRDLKPSNVMVTMHDATPVVKVIDFGIAKATGQQLTEKTLFTNFAQMIGTPMYMSPEQAQMSGLDIDTRSDIYALGVLLYELLTGTTPFDKERLRTAAFDEIRRIIREEEPARPSTRMSTLGLTATSASTNRQSDPKRLSHLFRGELDWIVMKAMEKDRNRRYESANGLAMDVKRYLHDEAVQACPPSAVYRFRKFARRHKALFLSGVAVSAALVLGTVVSSWQAIRATRAGHEAESARTEEAAQRAVADQRRIEADTEKERTEVALRAETKANNELDRALQREGHSLYFQRVARADLEWWANNVGRADLILDDCPPAYRHWEWSYLKRLCHADLVTLRGHSEAIISVAYSPDGRRLASASSDKTVRIWDLATGNAMLILQGHTRNVNSVAWSADGRLLASGSGIWDEYRPGELKLWDATTGRELRSFTGHQAAVRAVAFSPDSQHLVAANWDDTVRLWDLTTGQEIRTLRGHEFRCLAFSPDGRRLAAGCRDRVVIVWDAASGEQQRILTGHTADVHSVAFSPDSQRLVSGSWDQTVRVWDVASGNQIITPARHTDIVWGVAFSPDGQRVASASNDGSVKVWNAATGQELATLRGHSGSVNTVAFSPGGRCLASASWDHTVKVWDLTAEQQGRSFRAPARVFRSTLSRDGQRIAMGLMTPASPQRLLPLKIYEVSTGREVLFLGECGGGFHGAVFSPDGQRLASDWDKSVKIWDAQTGREVFMLAGHAGPVAGVTFSPDSQRLASASEDKTVKLWDAKAGKELRALAGHTDPVTSVAFSPDGQRLASASKDHTIKIWDVNSGRELVTLKGHDAPVTEVAFSPLGERLASASEDRTVMVWDSTTWEAILSIPGHTGAVTAVAFSPDGRRLVSASLDGSVRLWDAATGEEALTLRRQFNQVYGVAFTPDGERLVASGQYAGGEGFKVWGTQQSSQDRQAARDEALKADAQNACYRRGHAYAALGQWNEASADFTRAIDLGVQEGSIWSERGDAFAMLGQYGSAAGDFARAVEAKPDDPFLWRNHALAELGADNLDGYRRVCAGMRERFGMTKDPPTAGWLLIALTIAESGTATVDLDRWAKQVVQAPSDFPRFQGYALYREGQDEAAIDCFDKCAKAFPPRGGDLCVLAMAQQRLGKEEDARATLAKAVNWIANSERVLAGGGLWWWCEQVEVRYLRREAEALIDGKDKDQPESK